jgi:hypothetical protein
MRPYAQDDPPVLAKPPEITRIASSVLRDLCLPEGRDSRLPGRKPEAVPEIAVDEDADALASKDKVRRPWQRPDVLPEAKPPSVEG